MELVNLVRSLVNIQKYIKTQCFIQKRENKMIHLGLSQECKNSLSSEKNEDFNKLGHSCNNKTFLGFRYCDLLDIEKYRYL